MHILGGEMCDCTKVLSMYGMMEGEGTWYLLVGSEYDGKVIMENFE